MDKEPQHYFPDGTRAAWPLRPQDIERWEARKREKEYRLKEDEQIFLKVKNREVDPDMQFNPELEYPAIPPEMRTETDWKTAAAVKKARERCDKPKRKS